jgi:glycosyltransferase involved in cell wall biosynthesis
MGDPLISIIVPVYGVEKYLDNCVRSLIAQTYRNLEIILVDDGSKDRCPCICDDWAQKDDRVVVIHKENGGQGTARNAALDLFTGDYVLFVDSDDYIQISMIEKMVGASNNGLHDVVLCGMSIDNSIALRETKWYTQDFAADNQRLMMEYIRGSIFSGPVCKMFIRHVFKRLRFPEFRANEDVFIMHRLFGACETAYFLHDHLYTIRLRFNSTEGQKFNREKMHLIDCAKDLRAYVIENYPHYTDYVDNKVAKDTIYLLERLYLSGNQKEYADVKNELEGLLISEKTYLLNKGDNEEILASIDNYFNKPIEFKTRIQITRLIDGVKRVIKHLVSIWRQN